MASTITNITQSIDTGFPVAGQDNDTQGFRNNFANIKIGFERAAAEILDLEISQIAVANRLDSFTNPGAFNGSIVTATEIQSVTIVNSGSILTQDITSQGNISTNGKFIGDGSLITNIPINNVTSIGTLANVNVTANINLGIAVISTANNYLNISGVNQLYFADQGYSVVPKLYTTSTNASTVTLDYRNGQYQVVTLDTTSYSNTEFNIIGWPTSGNFSPIAVEIRFTGIPSGPIQTEFRNSCTTYGSTSTIVSIDDWIGTDFLGTTQLARGWAVYNTSSITTSTPVLTYISKVDSPVQISVFPGYNFVKGVPYYFVPKVGTTLPYKVVIDASIGQTLQVEENLSAEGIFNVTDVAVAHLYSYDGGATIFFNKLDIYN